MNRQIETLLRQMAETAGGFLTAEAVLAEAKKEASPLHAWPGFTWDRDKAALKRNLDEARTLMKGVRVIASTRTFQVQAPFFIKNPSTKSGYITLPKAKSDEDMAREIVIAEFARVSAALGRAKAVAAALNLTEKIEELDGILSQAYQSLQDQQAAGSA